jgi:Mn2+/Fe2+ NRAMP family transporter
VTEPAERRAPNALRVLGPGLVAGAADNDPTTVGAVAVVGATTAFGLAWVALLIAPILVVVQLIATRVGVLAGVDLQSAVRTRSRPSARGLLLVSIVAVTVLTLAADLQAGGASLGILTGLSASWFVTPLAVVLVAMLFRGTHAGMVRVLKYLALALLAYVGSALLAHVPWGQVLHHSVVPSISWTRNDLAGALALLGTTVTSYVYVWQTIALAEERPHRGALRTKELDAVIGTLFAVVIIWFILVATGATLGVHHHSVHSAQDAARALRPLAGSAASVVFGIGLLASALLAVPVLMNTAAFVVGAEFRWRRGLSEPVRAAPRFYAVLGASTLVALLVTFSGLTAIQLLFYASIAGGIGTPVGLASLLVVARDRTVMHGEPIGRRLAVAGWLVTGLIGVLSVLYLVNLGLGGS